MPKRKGDKHQGTKKRFGQQAKKKVSQGTKRCRSAANRDKVKEIRFT